MFKKKSITILLLIVFLSLNSLLYARSNDKLYIDGELFYINNRFLLQNNIQQYIHDNNFDNYFITHVNYYAAEFEIKENNFYLKELIIYPSPEDDENFNVSDCEENIIYKLRKINSTTILVVSKKQSCLIGIDNEENQFKIIEIKNNVVSKIYDLKNVEEFLKFRCEQFLKYKKTEDYKKQYYYSFYTIKSSRKNFNYEDENLSIEEETNKFMELIFLREYNYANIL